MLKMVSVVMATPAAFFAPAIGVERRQLPRRAMAMTAPGMRPASISAFSVAPIHASRSLE